MKRTQVIITHNSEVFKTKISEPVDDETLEMLQEQLGKMAGGQFEHAHFVLEDESILILPDAKLQNSTFRIKLFGIEENVPADWLPSMGN